MIQAAHVLSLDAQDERDRRSLPSLAPLAADIDSLLAIVESRLQDGRPELRL
jgi:hypothetical protein